MVSSVPTHPKNGKRSRFKRLTLHNFQKHLHLAIPITDRVLTIVGPNDQGKSSIIRGLQWLCLNRPNGSGFIRRGTKSAAVSLDVGAIRIKRRRSGRTNSYRVGNETYKAVATGVPEEVSSVLKLDPVCFQNQHDSAFWFNLSPGQVAKEMNVVCDLDIMDRTLKNISTELCRVRVVYQTHDEQLTKLHRERNDTKWIVRADKEYSTIEEMQNQLTELDEQIDELEEVLDQIAGRTSLIKAVDALLLTGNKAKQLYEKSTSLDEQMEELDSLLNEIEKASTPIPDTTTLLYILDGMGENEEQIEQLESMLEQINEAQAILDCPKGVCPTCRRPL